MNYYAAKDIMQIILSGKINGLPDEPKWICSLWRIAGEPLSAMNSMMIWQIVESVKEHESLPDYVFANRFHKLYGSLDFVSRVNLWNPRLPNDISDAIDSGDLNELCGKLIYGFSVEAKGLPGNPVSGIILETSYIDLAFESNCYVDLRSAVDYYGVDEICSKRCLSVIQMFYDNLNWLLLDSGTRINREKLLRLF